jgi:hypothetical protein
MNGIAFRAGDGRFGDRLARKLPLWYATGHETMFYHLGHSTWRLIQQGRKPSEWQRLYRCPQNGNGVESMIANGGAAFWQTTFADFRLLWCNRACGKSR